MEKLSVKEIGDLVTAVGVLFAAVLAWIRWGPGSGPRLLIRNLALLPPGTQKGINSTNLVIAIDAIFANLSPLMEFLKDVQLTIKDPSGTNYRYSSFMFAKEHFFFERDKAPDWVESLFHPIAIPSVEQKEEAKEVAKCIILFPDEKTPKFTPQSGEYSFYFTILKESAIPWRRKQRQKMILKMDKDDVETLTPTSSKYGKSVLLHWHFQEQRWWLT